ncbi:MAG: DUF86 domain-containing protein [Nanoarchaeota archaeon]
MKRDYKLYLNDIRESIRYIESYTLNISEEEFNKNTQLQDALARRLEIIGEAVRNIPRILKERNIEVPWFEMAQFRNLTAHSYYEVSLGRIWQMIKKRIPVIKEAINKLVLV